MSAPWPSPASSALPALEYPPKIALNCIDMSNFATIAESWNWAPIDLGSLGMADLARANVGLLPRDIDGGVALPPITQVIEARAAMALRQRISEALGEADVLELS